MIRNAKRQIRRGGENRKNSSSLLVALIQEPKRKTVNVIHEPKKKEAKPLSSQLGSHT